MLRFTPVSKHVPVMWLVLSRWKLWSWAPTPTISWRPQSRCCPCSRLLVPSVACTVIRSEASAFRCLWSLVAATNPSPCSGTVERNWVGTVRYEIQIRIFFNCSGLDCGSEFKLFHYTAQRSSAFFRMHLPIAFPSSSSQRSMRKSKQLPRVIAFQTQVTIFIHILYLGHSNSTISFAFQSSLCCQTICCFFPSPDIPVSLWLGICTGYQRWWQCGNREARGSCAFCPAAKSVRVHWGPPSPRRAPRLLVAAPWCLRSWSTMNLSAENTTHSGTSGY